MHHFGALYEPARERQNTRNQVDAFGRKWYTDLKYEFGERQNEKNTFYGSEKSYFCALWLV